MNKSKQKKILELSALKVRQKLEKYKDCNDVHKKK